MRKIPDTYVSTDSPRWHRIQSALPESGWVEYEALGQINHYDHKDRHRTNSDLEVRDALAAVIAGLGLREAYANETQTVTEYGHYGQQFRRTVVSSYGADRFLADVKAAAEVARGTEARERIAAALKAKK